MPTTETIYTTFTMDPKITPEIKKEIKETQSKLVSSYAEREAKFNYHKERLQRAHAEQLKRAGKGGDKAAAKK